MPEAPRVLVVDDDPEICDLIGSLLRSGGYRADCVYDGRTAIDHVAAGRPDAIVLDVMLPDMTGFEVCQSLKLHRETNLIPILMLTALSDHESLQSGLRVGANRYLTKPFDPASLLLELGRAMDHCRQLSERRTHTCVELHMQSDTHARRQLNDLLSELFVLTPLSDDEIHEVRYATLEMIENAAEWGNRRRKDLMVTIAYEVTDAAVKFVITDEGPGFNPHDLPHAADGKDPMAHMEIREKVGLRHGGFGILISRGMVDEFSYNEAGNQVTLIKHFRPPQPTS
jgi:two-component system OmpR family response regulator